MRQEPVAEQVQRRVRALTTAEKPFAEEHTAAAALVLPVAGVLERIAVVLVESLLGLGEELK